MNTVLNVASDEALVHDSYEKVKGDWAALEADQLLQVNLDIPLATQTILGTLPEVRGFRERLAALPAFDVKAFDKLEDYVLALMYVQVRYAMATQPPDDLKDLIAESAKLRERLVADATALSLRDLFDPRKLAALKGANGYRNVAHDLLALGQELDRAFAQIQGKSAISQDELKAAMQMGTRLMRVVGVREQSPAVLASITEERMRAFTQVIKVYEEARAGIEWLRRNEGDAATIAPNLYTGKSVRAKATPEPAAPGDGQADHPGQTGQSGQPIAIGTTPVVSGAGGAGAAGVAAGASSGSAPVASPGGSSSQPFLNS